MALSMNELDRDLPTTDFVDRLNYLTAGLSLNGKKLVQYFPFAFIGLLVVLKLASWPLYWKVMAMEDGPAEYLTSLAYLIASGIALWMWMRLGPARWKGVGWMAAGCALVFFVIGMEEISWGQRLFSVQSPDFFVEHNRQGEITLHNFLSRYPLHMLFIVAGLYGAFAWKYFPQQWCNRFPGVTQFLIPDRVLQWYFLPTMLIYVYYDYLSILLVNVLGLEIFQWQSGMDGWILAKDQEPIELLMAIGIMFFMAILLNRQTHGRLSGSV